MHGPKTEDHTAKVGTAPGQERLKGTKSSILVQNRYKIFLSNLASGGCEVRDTQAVKPLRLLRHVQSQPSNTWRLQFVEKEINCCDPTVPRNDKVSPGISWSLTWTARYPSDTATIAQFFGFGNRLILEIRVSSLNRARDAIDLIAASIDASLGIVEHAVFGKYLVYSRAPTRRGFSPKTSRRLRMSKVDVL